LSFLVFGRGDLNDEMGLETRNLFFHIRDAIQFLRQKANTPQGDSECRSSSR
jgi:hypothetical protein